MRVRHSLVRFAAVIFLVILTHIMFAVQKPDPELALKTADKGQVTDLYAIRKPEPQNTSALTTSEKRILADFQASRGVSSIPLNEVFYFWCGNRTMFEFRHFLSVRSVFLHLNPYRVRLFYENRPIAQTRAYNTWLTELRRNHAFFSLDKLPAKWCENKRTNINGFVSKYGGTYVHEDVILAGPLDQRYNVIDSVTVLDDATGELLIQVSRRRNSINSSSRLIVSSSSNRMVSINGTVRVGDLHADDCRFNTGTVTTTISGDRSWKSKPLAELEVMLFKATMQVFPEHIWELNSEAGRLLRLVAYGKPELARPVPDYSRLAPNIAHVVWSNNDTMTFEFYLCVLSLLEVARLDAVFIHGDGPPTGFYWDLISNHPRLRLATRTLIDGNYERVYGNDVNVRAHVVDVLRADILYRYGGLYVDTDAIFFRPLTRELRAYDAVLSPDISRGHRGFPNSYQNGIMLGKPGAKFWLLHIESMRRYYDDDWLWNCCFGMYRIKERHPETVLSEPRLNTICYLHRCYPYWEPGWLSKTDEQTTELMKQWRNNTFAIHPCLVHLPEYHSHEALLENNGTTLYGEVALYVLERAGKLDFFKKLNRKI